MQGLSVGPARYRSWSPIHDAWYASRIRRWRSSIGALGKPTGLRLSNRGPIFVGPKWPRFQHPSCPGNIQSAKLHLSVMAQFKRDRTTTPLLHFRNALKQFLLVVTVQLATKFSATKFQFARWYVYTRSKLPLTTPFWRTNFIRTNYVLTWTCTPRNLFINFKKVFLFSKKGCRGVGRRVYGRFLMAFPWMNNDHY